jgi:hypothetical protein
MSSPILTEVQQGGFITRNSNPVDSVISTIVSFSFAALFAPWAVARTI